ncbi:MAG: PAS domain-containing protein [Alphaproteobacteria bacterium]|nr:PAS domain-containing protein [Alphaproteobacteria bacterium]
MMSMELLKHIILLSIVVETTMIVVIMAMQVKIYKYRRKIYFIKRDRERCNEMLFSAKDGYFCFVYPDQKVKDKQKDIVERCSRRLAVMLGLKNGIVSSFANVLDAFHKEDTRILKKYISLLQQEGHAFEDILRLKDSERLVCVYGSRINGADGNHYCDAIWFRDVSAENAKITALENARQSVQNDVAELENMIDGINYPLWLRDENLNLIAVNKKYVEYSGAANKSEVLEKGVELTNNNGDSVAKRIATEAQLSKKIQKSPLNMVRGGALYNYEIQENPYFIADNLDKIGTVGLLTDHTELEKLKRNFKVNQNSHLEILGTLGTAFAIFDGNMNLFFYNPAFRDLWNLDNDFLEKTPTYPQFLDTIREHKLLPPVPDFKTYKEDEQSVFKGLWETREDLLHLPDGRTIRRFRTPHPNGVIFAFEDVSDRLATMRRLNDLTSMQQSILDNLSDSVVIFGTNQRLKFYNRAYLKLWSLDFAKMQDEPKLEKILNYQKLFFSNVADWDIFKQSMISNITEGRKFDLLRDDNVNISVSPLIFYDGSIMITYTVKPNKEKK